MPTFDANVLPASTGQDLGSSGQRWDVNAQNIEVSGQVKVSGTTSNGFLLQPTADVDGFTLIPNADGQTTVAFGVTNAANDAWKFKVTKDGVVDATGYSLNGSPFTSPVGEPAVGTLGGVFSSAAVSNQFLTAINTDGSVSRAQPSFSDISGVASAGQIPTKTIHRSITLPIDGGGSVPATGVYGQITVPVNCTITGWDITADASGSAVVDILKSTYANFPTTSSIAGTAKPTLSSVQKNQNHTLTGWGNTALVAGDQLQWSLSSVSTCKRIFVTLLIDITE